MASPLDFDLPAGFTLDEPETSSAAPEPPAGFTLDKWEPFSGSPSWPDPAKTGLAPEAQKPAPEPKLPAVRTDKRQPASVRYFNPGAMYPGPSSKKFGATATETIGGGHKIAVFPDMESGAAAQFDLLDRGYTGMPLQDALRKWSGGNHSEAYTKAVSRATGLSPDAVLTPGMLRDPAVAVPLAKAMARVEAGTDFPMSDEEWQRAHARAFGAPIQTASAPGSDAPAQAPRDAVDLLRSVMGAPPEQRRQIVEDYLHNTLGIPKPPQRELPPGFTLDGQPDAALPDGFTLDGESESETKAATFGESFGRGVDIAQQLGYGAAEAFGELTGLEGLTEFGREGRERNIQEAEAYGPRARFLDIGGVGDFVQWAKETVGEQIPIMAPTLAGAGAGALAGAPLGPLGATIGAAIGAFVPSFMLGVGEVQSAIKEKDEDTAAPGWAIAGGTAIAALDSILPGKIGSTLVRSFGRETAEEIAKRALAKPLKDGWIKRTAKGAAKGMAIEGVTEALQEAISEVSAAQATGQPIDTASMGEQMIEAGAAGALLGGIMGGPTAAVERRTEPTIVSEPAEGAPPERQAAPEAPAAEPAPPPPASADDSALLRAQGWTDEEIADMDPAERAEEIAAARLQGVTPLAPDQPTAEPSSDLVAQARDLTDTDNPRRGLYVPRSSLETLLNDPDGANALANVLEGKAVSIDDFDGQGGMLVVPDDATAQWAVEQKDSGRDLQEIIGELTGAGRGKPASGSAVVQQVTPEGEVTRESLVTEDQVAATEEDFAQPGRDVRTVTPEEALQRREDEIAAEQEQAPAGDGSRQKPVKVQAPEDIERAGERVQEPTEAQAEAGNYPHAHLDFQGLQISVETPKGGTRRGVKDGKEIWRVDDMPAAYGYVKRTEGKDGDQFDVYVGDAIDSDRVFVVDQVDAETGRFDEHKGFLGFTSEDEVRAAYERAFSDGRATDRLGGITEMSVDEFKDWLAKGKRTRPLTDLARGEQEPAGPAAAAPVPETAAAPVEAEEAPETGPSDSEVTKPAPTTKKPRLGTTLETIPQEDKGKVKAAVDRVRGEAEESPEPAAEAPAEPVEPEPAPAAQEAAESAEAAPEPAEAQASTDPLAPLVVVLRGAGFKTIVEARKLVKEAGILPPDATNKQIDETIESAVVAAARQIVAEGGTPVEVYQRLIELYGRQPNLGTRTSTSVANQAYSTPVPLAYIASRLARVATADVVYEPTAGNGALLIEAGPGNDSVHANELDPARAAELERQGFDVTTADATDRAHVEAPPDAIVMNPPFGAVREGGKSKDWTIDGWTTSQVDHAIALQSLKAMTDDGRAVLILGGIKAESIEERRKGYRGKAKREFYFRLYNQYNVTDHFTVDGDLYAKQGAGWPVDVVVIEGKGKSARALPAAQPPAIFKDWDSLAEKLPDAQPLAQSKREAGRDREPARSTSEPVGESARRDARDREDAVRRRSGELERPARDNSVPVRTDDDRGESAALRRDRRDEDGVPARADRDRRGADQPHHPGRGRPRVRRPAEGGQARYEPASAAKSLDALIPVNMADAARAAMERVESRHGPVDAFVADRLGYKPDELSKYLSAEQIDAVATAIDNVERGSAMILGDQTGQGKGRVAAAMLRYAMRQGKTPVLVTEKADLYGDMFRDMRDIGLPEMLGREPRIFMTNSNEAIALDEEALAWKQEADAARDAGKPTPKRRGRFLVSRGKAGQDADMRAVAKGEGKHDVVFTTYDQMNTVKGETTARRSFLSAIAPKSMIVFDESHGAAGTGQRGWKKKGATPNRSQFAREIAANAWGVMFSSATYAKRPDVMDLYARTDMGKAVDDPKMLPELIAKGGVPMQQIVATMLADSGQYMRRERSFEGVEYAVEGVPVREESYRQFSDAIRAVFQFDLALQPERKKLFQAALDAAGKTIAKDAGVGDMAAHTTAFASVMHNIVNQMLLSIKTNEVAKRAIAAHKAGEKPVIGLSSTMEAFVTDFAAGEGITVGEAIDLSFRDVLARYLRRTLRVSVKTPDGKTEHIQVSADELPGHLQRMYRDALDIINEGDYEGLPISPIDAIRDQLTKAGLKVSEITGRQTMIDYSESPPRYVARPKREMGPSGKRGSISAFNRGALDALIINRSGSTGVSMHASATFRDQKRRRMILAQAEGNIDTHLQLLGRVHRTGQVVPPAYSQIAAEIPAEARPTAVLMRKMASLNANTTGARGSVFMSDAVDFINEIGDRVVANVVEEDPELDSLLGSPLKTDNDGKATFEDAAKRVTGRLTLLTPEKQAEILDRITSAYKAELEQLDALGENPLEAKTLDLRARTLDSTEIKPRQGDSPFLEAVTLEKVSVKAQGRAMAPDEVARRVAETLKAEKPGTDPASSLRDLENKGQDWARETWRTVGERARTWIAREVAEVSDNAKASTESRHQDTLSRWRSTLQVAYPGARVRLGMPAGDVSGVVLKVERTGKAKNPVALGSWEVRIAVPESDREYIFPMSKLFPPTETKSDDEKGATIARDDTSFADLMPKFEEARREGRENRFVFTGNILAAYDQTAGRGRIINFTTESGELRPGILMGREFSQTDFMESRKVRFQSGDQVAQFLARVPDAEIKSTDGLVTLRLERDGLSVIAPASRATGGRIYTDPDVRRAVGVEFERRQNQMVARGIPTSRTAAVADAIRGVGAIFETRESQEVAQEIVGTSVAEPGAASLASLASVADPRRFTPEFIKAIPDFQRALRDEIGRMLPPGTPVHVVSDIVDRFGYRRHGETDVASGAITLSLFYGRLKALETGKHEVVHVLRSRGIREAFARMQRGGGLPGFGLYSDKEWALLVRRAKETGVEAHITIPDADGNPVSALPAYREMYTEFGRNYGLNGEPLLKFVDELMDQELVAAMSEVWKPLPLRHPKRVDLLLARLRNFLQGVWNALNGRGFHTEDDIFERQRVGEIGRRAAGQGPSARMRALVDTPARDPVDRIKARMLLRQPVDLSQEAETVLEVLRSEAPPVPGLIRETAVSSIKPRKGHSDQFIVTIREVDGTEYEIVERRDDVLQSAALFDFLPDGSPFVAFFGFDLRGDFVQRLRGERAHEWLHGLRALGHLPGRVSDAASPWSRLVRHADSLGVMEGTLYDHLTRIEHPRAENVRNRDATIFETYHKAYRSRKDYREAMGQESVAHMVQQYVHGVLSEQDVAPVKDILDGMLAGRTAGREAIQAGMRQEDITSLAAKGGRLFAFAGERASTADVNALARAKQMEAEGKNRTAIWNATGWFKGVDGKWRFEIDDSEASAVFGGPTALSNLLHHPRLTQTYPSLFDEQSEFIKGVSGGGQFGGGLLIATGESPDALRRVAFHEVQHAVQREEGFARGGAAATARDLRPPEVIEAARQRYAAEARRLFSEAADLIRADRFDEGNALQARAYALERLAENLKASGSGAYRRLAGEVEARTVERRMDMTPEERRARPPWEDYDVPEDQQIVRMGDGAMFSLATAPTGAGLDMSPEARKARAEAMGFDTSRVLYHGTTDHFPEFDPRKLGRATGAASATMGFFFASNPAVASSYASEYSFYRDSALGRALNKLTFGQYERANEALVRALGLPSAAGDGRANVVPVYLRMRNPLVHDFKGKEEREETYASIIARGKREGHDGVILRNTFDPGFEVSADNEMTDIHVVFDPANIRSVNAEFDPAKESSPILLASAIPQLSAETRRDLSLDLTEALNILNRIAGKDYDVAFFDQIPADVAAGSDQRAATERMGRAALTAGGFYQRATIDGRALIGLALNDPNYNPRTNAGHEAWHHVEEALATDPELRLIRSPSEMARTRRLAAAEIGMDPADPRLDSLPDKEVRAVAFQRYRRMREEGAQPAGIHIGVRRLWDRIIRILQAVRNVVSRNVSLREAMAGAGSTEAIFERARRGEMAGRSVRSAGAQVQRMAALPPQRPRGTLSLPGRTVERRPGDRLPSPRTILYAPVPVTAEIAAWLGIREGAHITIEIDHILNKRLAKDGDPELDTPEKVKAFAEDVLANGAFAYRYEQGEQWNLMRVMPNGVRRLLSIRLDPNSRGDYEVKTAFNVRPDSWPGRILKSVRRNGGIAALKWKKDPLAVGSLLEDVLQANRQARDPSINSIIKELRREQGRLKARQQQTGERDDRLANIIPNQPQPQLTPQAVIRRGVRRTMSRVMNTADRARVLVQDKVLPIRRLQEQKERDLGIKLPVNLDVYLAEALYHGRAGERLQDLRSKFIEPLIDKMRAADIKADELGDYLYARHAPERNAAIREIDPDNDAGSGMTDQEAAAILDRIRRSGKQAEYDEIARIVDTIRLDTLDTLLRSGNIDRETYDNWKNKYPHYAPLRGFEVEDEDGSTFPRTGRGFDVRGPESFRALGRRSKADNPLLYMVQQAQQAIVRAEKNRVDKTLYRQVQAHPDPSLWKIYKGESRRRVNPETGLVETYWVPPAFVHRDNIVGVKIGGKQHWIEIKHPGLARAIRGVGSEIQGTILGRALFKAARTYAGLLTSYNPEFLFSNFFRDVQTALVNVSDVAEKPEGTRRKILKEALSAKAIRGAFKALRGDTSTEYARWFEEFRMAGAKISYLEYNDIDRIRKDITKSLSRGRTMRALRNTARLVEDLNTAVENGVRLSVYKTLRENGVAQDRAAFVARELTVNFNRKGEWGPTINALYLFFNASVQGTTRIAQAFARSKAVRWAVGSIFATGVALDLINFLIAGDDDDGENAYDKIPDWVKERNLIIMMPGGSVDDRLMIPLAYGYNVPFLAGQQAMSVIRGVQKPLHAGATVAASAWDAFNPIGSAASFWQFVAPTFLDPVVQVRENKTWHGGPIFPQHKPKHQPWSETFQSSTPAWAVEVARIMNQMTGGNQARSGLVDISPDVLEHYLEFAMGGAGKFVLNTIATGERVVSSDEWLPEKTPFIRRLYGKTTTGSRYREFYDAWDQVDAAFYEVKELAKAGDREGSLAARQTYRPELSAYPTFKATAKMLRDIRKLKSQIEADDRLAAEEKRRRIEDLRKREHSLILKSLSVYARAQKDVRRAPEPVQ